MRHVAWIVAGWGVTLLIAGLVLHLTRPAAYASRIEKPYEFLLTAGATIALGAVGAFIVSRQPRNPIGWAFLAAGVSFGYGAFAPEYVVRAIDIDPGSLPFAAPLAWLSDWLTMLTIWLPIFLIPYTFPTGRLLSRRWVPGLAIGILAVVGLDVGTAFGPYVMPDYVHHLHNPLYSPTIDRSVAVIGGFLWLLPFVSLTIGAISLIVRFRRSRGVERQQLKWIAFSGLFVLAGCALLLVNVFLPLLRKPTVLAPALIVFGMGSMPITVTIAILRYRLYDVDRLLRRSVSYLLVTVLLAALYAVVVLAPSILFHSKHIPNALVALATLLAAAAFVPVRRGVQGAVDRRFNRSRYDAEQTIGRFGSRLKLEVDVDALTSDLAGVVQRTMQPASVGLWIRPR